MIFLHHVRGAVLAGDEVLDAGYGARRYTLEVIEMGARATAFDHSPLQLELCRERAQWRRRRRRGLRHGRSLRRSRERSRVPPLPLEELCNLMPTAGFQDVSLLAAGFHAMAYEELELPEPGTPQYEFLVKAELAACAKNPGGGPHIIASGVRP